MLSIVFSMVPYVCSVFSMCSEYPVLPLLCRMSCICSLYLVLNVLPACPVYTIGQSRHFIRYMPLLSYLFLCNFGLNIMWRVMSLKTPFRLLIPLFTISHIQSFVPLCHIYTAYKLTRQYSILDVHTYTSTYRSIRLQTSQNSPRLAPAENCPRRSPAAHSVW
jgi:hypothetical protein